ncbi:immunity 49 family protein [Shewanella baltica]|uniref:immunity 49 family protein n=1 Tax=Shewanella baltica TaxID=62322 RepID=UPI00217DD999|nr:immunity 49 family protein [Shewanella baltica]MCS6158921.1 immunity 49 family protein [Shewanella baltica]
MAKICFETGIDRLNWTVEPGIDDALEFILTNTGSRQGCLLELKSYYYAKSLLSWFKDGDLEQLRQHAYTSAKLYRLYYQRANSVWQGAFCHFMALISDHEPLINWHSQFISPLYRVTGGKAVRNRVGCPEYHAFQAILALQGKWDLLGERAEYILANPPGQKMAKYQIDQEFYLALAKGDVPAMEQVLNSLTGPKAKVRNFDGALGLTEHLMSLFGFIYAKMAWRAGYQVQVDSPYLPMEWLPISPLTTYRDEYDFLADFDLFQLFTNEMAPFSPVSEVDKRVDVTVGSSPFA